AAQDAAVKVREKMGADSVKVSRMEIHQDEFEIVVQDPQKPKNFDKYTYKGGAVTGPEPVEAMVLGDKELTADKMPLFALSEVNLGAMPEVCRKAVERAQIEDGKCDLISIDWEAASNTRNKEEQKKIEESRKNLNPMERIRSSVGDLAVTWRIWVKGPRMTKYFWADAKGNLAEGSGK
ncbi:MAG TPA: hypothetical protein VGB17_00110, partial [Pyrinomonadaceae bacterium]